MSRAAQRAFNVFEPLGIAGTAPPNLATYAKTYTEGLARFRARDFAGAADIFARAAADDPPSALLMERARHLAHRPPEAEWEPINVLDEK